MEGGGVPIFTWRQTGALGRSGRINQDYARSRGRQGGTTEPMCRVQTWRSAQLYPWGSQESSACIYTLAVKPKEHGPRTTCIYAA